MTKHEQLVTDLHQAMVLLNEYLASKYPNDQQLKKHTGLANMALICLVHENDLWDEVNPNKK